jgi:hypothetical protein
VTLVLSLATSKIFAQVSDRRLTRADGTVFDDDANKSVVVYCWNAMFGLGYAGLARIGNAPTDEYLTDLFTDLRSPSQPIHVVLGEAQRLLTERFQRPDLLAVSPRYRLLSVVGVGFGGTEYESLAFQLSNFDHWRGPASSTARPTFGIDTTVEKPGRAPLVLVATGDQTALSARVQARLKALRKRRFFHNNPAERVVETLVALLRESADSQRANRKTIGRHCMALWATKKPFDVQARYYDDLGRATAYGPNMVHLHGSMKQVRLKLPPGYSVRFFGGPEQR